MSVNRAAYLSPDHRFELRHIPVPEPRPGEARVRIVAQGICGSDVHFFTEGRLGNFVVERPYIPGHEACGVIEAVGEGVESVASGDHVAIEPGLPCGRCDLCRKGRYNLCPDVYFLSEPPKDGTFRDMLTIREDGLHPMPEGLSFEAGALAEPLAVGAHGVSFVPSPAGASAIVLGCGPIGLLTMLAFRCAGGGRITAVEPVEARRQRALELGAVEAFEPEAAGDCSADAVFVTAGSSAAARQAIRLARPGGTVVQIGWPEANEFPVDVAVLMEKELALRGVNRYANAFPAALAWLADGRIPVDKLITHRFAFEQIEEAFRYVRDHPDEVVKALVLQEGTD